MWRWIICSPLTLVLGVSWGCRLSSEGASPSSTWDASQPLPMLEADVRPTELSAPEGAPFALTPERMDRFIAYQQRMVSLYREALAADAGGRWAEPERLLALARAERRAREEAGLSGEELRLLERVVGDVLARRTVARTLEPELSLSRLQALQAKLGPEQQTLLESTVTQLREERDTLVKLSEERELHGSANVDAVLEKEDALREAWTQRLEVFVGATPAFSKPDAQARRRQ